MLILAFPDYLPQSRNLADKLGLPLQEVARHRFPDGESLIRLPTPLPEHVVICRSLNQPNDKLIELMLCAETARQLGARRVTLIAPYLCYMRQDIANHPGEAVSQRIVGALLADLFDDVITVDPHLHRISALNEAIPIANAISVSASGTIAGFLKDRFEDALLLGPDSESEQWVAGIASTIGFDYAVARKTRLDDLKVEVNLPDYDYRRQPVIIIDDMVSTGRTLADTVRLLKRAGADRVYAAVTHALFCGDAEAQLRTAGLDAVWSTDSVTHSTSCMKLDTLLAETLKTIV